MSFIIFILGKISGTEFDDGYLVQQVLLNDLDRITLKQAEHYVNSFSPSKLGKLGFLGLRKLAMIKRDEPEKWREWEQEYLELKKQGIFKEEDEREIKELDLARAYLRKAIELAGVHRVEQWLQEFKKFQKFV